MSNTDLITLNMTNLSMPKLIMRQATCGLQQSKYVCRSFCVI